MATDAHVEVDERYQEYEHAGKVCNGYFVVPKNVSADKKLLTVVLIHEYRGQGEHVREAARRVAALGYLAFAVDQYGKGVLAKSHEEALGFLGAFLNDAEYARACTMSGVRTALAHPNSDRSKLVVMGYCFGGVCSLALALAGEDITAAVSFHGVFRFGVVEPQPPIKAKIVVFHGETDPLITPESFEAFRARLRAAKADYQLICFGETLHGFTVKDLSMPGMSAYKASADWRSWRYFTAMLEEIDSGLHPHVPTQCAATVTAQAACC